MSLSLAILVLSLVALVVRVATAQRAAGAPGALTLYSIRQPREIRRAARIFFGEGGWVLSDRSVDSVVFSYDTRPRGLLLVVLLLIGVLPGVIAVALGRKALIVTVTAHEDAGGSATRISWSADDAAPPCRDFAEFIRSQEPSARRAAPQHPLRRSRRRRKLRRNTNDAQDIATTATLSALRL